MPKKRTHRRWTPDPALVCRGSIPVVLVFALGQLLCKPCRAAEALAVGIDAVGLGPGVIEILFQDGAPAGASYRLDASSDAGATGWRPEVLEAEDLGSGRFRFTVSREGEAARYFRIARLPPPIESYPVRLNEVMTANASALADEDGDFPDWVELQNFGTTPVSLAGWLLADALESQQPWVFPDRLLEPGACLLLFASGKDRNPIAGELHSDFALRNGSEPVVLLDPNGILVDRLLPPALDDDIALGLFEDVWYPYPKELASPGLPNRPFPSGTPDPVLEPPWLLTPGGIHSAPVQVAFETGLDGAAIRFTLDGAEPLHSLFSSNSTLYDGPFMLTQSAVVRVRTFLPGGRSRTLTRTYIIGAEHNLPIVALAGDPSAFAFGDGFLYGMGPALNAGGSVNGSFPYSNSNAWQDREIAIHFEFFDPEARTLEMGAGLKIFGGWGSRGYPQKSFALFARRKYGAGSIQHRIFPELDIERFESLVLRNSGNDNQSTHFTWPRPPITAFGQTQAHGSYFVNSRFTLFRDAMLQRLVRETGLDIQAWRPAVLYLNGDYWGVYNLREKTTEHFVASHHHLEPDSIDLIEGYGTANAGSAAIYSAMRSFVAGRDLSLEDNYARVASEHLDIPNFIDYHLAVIYFQNFDIGNIKCWRSDAGDGKFRWILYDQDYGFDLWPPETYGPAMSRDYADYDNMFRFYTNPAGSGTGWPNEGGRTLLLRKLLENADFQGDFIQRCASLLNTLFEPARVESVIDDMAAQIRPEIERHLRRWSWPELERRGFGPPHKPAEPGLTLGLWEENVDGLKDFARSRPAELRDDLIAHFQLPNGFGELEVRLDPPDGGSVRAGSALAAGDGWRGTWFVDFPPPIQSLPAPGFRHASWQGPLTEKPDGSTFAQVQRDQITTIAALFHAVSPLDPSHTAIVISELQYHPAGDQTSGEWIELHNAGTSPVTLTGWSILDDDDDHRFLLPEIELAPGGFLIVAREPDAFLSAYPNLPVSIAGGFDFNFSNSSDRLRLLDAGGALIVSLRYEDQSPWPAADGSGHTMELVNPAGDPADPTSWRTSPALGGSPGE
ncbi:MAG TPA: CotH kinase family protein [Verrucomicrobiales bacterium]|nr:CotH kinase family protein [Verrucomicrobiales bacterium]